VGTALGGGVVHKHVLQKRGTCKLLKISNVMNDAQQQPVLAGAVIISCEKAHKLPYLMMYACVHLKKI